jgi:hypothetical protein
MKISFSFILFCFLCSSAFAQKVIELDEVKVFPENFSYELIAKMKVAIKDNFQKGIQKYDIDIESVKNDIDTIAYIKQQSLIQLNALKINKFKILKSSGKAYFQKEFYKLYDPTRLFRFGLLEGRLNYLLNLSEFPFFNNFIDYRYQIFDLDNYYEISFTSTDKFVGKFKISKETYNILELEFDDISNFSYVNRHLTTGTSKYINEIINIRKSIDKAHLYFLESDNKKIHLNMIYSTIKLDKYEVIRYELNKANKIISKDNMRLYTNFKLQKKSML